MKKIGLTLGLTLGLTFGLTLGLIFGLTFGLTLGLTFGLTLGLTFGLTIFSLTIFVRTDRATERRSDGVTDEPFLMEKCAKNENS